MALITVQEYMQQRRKAIDAYVQGEHAWLGDVHACTQVTYNSHPVPWYWKEEAPVLK